MAANLLGVTSVDAVITSMIGMLPIITGREVHYNLMYIDALHACNESNMTVIHLG
jgi:hypothetical protein